MIVLEGPDGAGKTTLLNVLQAHFDLPKHERFATSEGGPIEGYVSAAFKDIQSIHTQPLSIYDRHVMVSEYAYASAIPERMVKDDFLEGWAMKMLSQMAKASLVVFCIPPYSEVKKNVHGCAACGHIHTSAIPTSGPCLFPALDEESLCGCEEMVDPVHMPGVAENLAAIYQMYRILHVFWPEPNRAMLYDYTKPEAIKRVLSRTQLHISEWRKTHV